MVCVRVLVSVVSPIRPAVGYSQVGFGRPNTAFAPKPRLWQRRGLQVGRLCRFSAKAVTSQPTCAPTSFSWPSRLPSHHALSHGLAAHCTLQKYHLAHFDWKRKWMNICATPLGSSLNKFQVCEFTGEVSKGEKSIDLNLF